MKAYVADLDKATEEEARGLLPDDDDDAPTHEDALNHFLYKVFQYHPDKAKAVLIQELPALSIPEFMLHVDLNDIDDITIDKHERTVLKHMRKFLNFCARKYDNGSKLILDPRNWIKHYWDTTDWGAYQASLFAPNVSAPQPNQTAPPHFQQNNSILPAVNPQAAATQIVQAWDRGFKRGAENYLAFAKESDWDPVDRTINVVGNVEGLLENPSLLEPLDPKVQLTPAQQVLDKKKSSYFFLVQMVIYQTDSGKVLVREFVRKKDFDGRALYLAMKKLMEKSIVADHRQMDIMDFLVTARLGGNIENITTLRFWNLFMDRFRQYDSTCSANELLSDKMKISLFSNAVSLIPELRQVHAQLKISETKGVTFQKYSNLLQSTSRAYDKTNGRILIADFSPSPELSANQHCHYPSSLRGELDIDPSSDDDGIDGAFKVHMTGREYAESQKVDYPVHVPKDEWDKYSPTIKKLIRQHNSSVKPKSSVNNTNVTFEDDPPNPTDDVDWQPGDDIDWQPGLEDHPAAAQNLLSAHRAKTHDAEAQKFLAAHKAKHMRGILSRGPPAKKPTKQDLSLNNHEYVTVNGCKYKKVG